MPPKQAPEKVETRLISGRGILKIPKDTSVRLWYVYVNLVRFPVVNFDSSKINPSKSEYARFTWCRKDYVLRENVLNFEHQLYLWEADPIGYVPPYLACVFEGVNSKLDYLITLAGGVPPVQAEPIYCEALDNYPDVIKFTCRLNAAIEVELWRYRYDVACSNGENVPPPPPDPLPRPKTPTDIPIGDISPPYDEPDDGGDTTPYDDDETAPPTPPPEGEQCSVITVSFSADYYSTPTAFETIATTVQVYGEATRPFIAPSIPGLNGIEQVYITSRGIIQLLQPCGDSATQALTNLATDGGVRNLVITGFDISAPPS